MFKAVITEESIEIRGTTIEALTGLACYIDALKEDGIPKELIEKTVEMALKDTEKVETILDNDKIKVQKFDLNGLSKEEAEKILKKELFDKLFD